MPLEAVQAEGVQRFNISEVGAYCKDMTYRALQKIYDLSLDIIFAVGAAILFLENSSLFMVGFVIGAVSPLWMEEMLGNIKNISKRILEQKMVTTLLCITVASMLSFPQAAAISAFFVGGMVGTSLKPVNP